MGLIKRNEKGSKLTVQELDGNLTYLESIGIDGFNQPINNVIEIEKINGETVSGSFNSYNTDIEEIVNENVVVYKNTQYDNFDGPPYEIILKDDNGEPIELLEGESCFLDCNLTMFGNETKTGFLPDNDGDYEYLIFSIQIQSDGKILVGGRFESYNGITSNGLIRLNSDGSVDDTFNIGTGFVGSVRVIKIQSDGKILVGGGFEIFNGDETSNGLIRLNSNGSIDDTFSIGTVWDGLVSTIQIQSDGKILVGGWFVDNRIIRLNSDGSVDDTFNIGTGFNEDVYTIQIQSDGKILVGGRFESYNGTTSNRIIRLNSDGTVDNTFNIGTGFDNDVEVIQIQSDGKILIGGFFGSYNGTFKNKITRLNSDGTVDNTFNIGTGFDNSVESIAIQSDGKILVGGWFNEYNFNQYFGLYNNRLIRLNSDGSVDDTLYIGNGFSGGVYEIQIQSNGEILVGGDFENFNQKPTNYITRLNSDGSVGNFNLSGDESYSVVSLKTFKKRNTQYDTDFSIGTGFSNDVHTIQIQSDSKILVGGRFYFYNGTIEIGIVRLNSSGSVDNTFNIGTGFGGSIDNDYLYFVNTIQIQSDGKILVGGDFTTYNGTSNNRIIRLNSDGSVDDTFNVGDGFNDSVRTIKIQSDGKILVAGYFTTYNGTTSNRIVRLNSDGSIDNTFNMGTGFNNEVYVIQIQSDGKILVGGFFTSYNGTTRNLIVRLNSDGTVDNTFNIGTGFNNYVFSIQIQSDGKILVGGRFTTYNGTGKRRIIRLNSNGSIDNTFRIGVGFFQNGDVLAMAIQSDGKIIVSGPLRTYHNMGYSKSSDFYREYLTRLNSDGSFDITFVPFQSFLSSSSIQILSDGKILIGGYYGLLRLTDTGLNSTNIDGSIFNKFFITQISSYGNDGNNYGNNVYEVRLSPNDEVVKIKSFLPINKSMISYKLIKIK